MSHVHTIFANASLNNGFNITKASETGQVTVEGPENAKLSGEPIGVQLDAASSEWMEACKYARAHNVSVQLIGKLSLGKNLPAIVRACMPNASQGRVALDINTRIETGQRILPSSWLVDKRLAALEAEVAYLKTLRKSGAKYGIAEGQYVIVELAPRGSRTTLSRNAVDELSTED